MKTVEEITVAAFDYNVIPDSDLPIEEQLLWYMLRDLYQRFRTGAITKETGEAEKNRAMMMYKSNVAIRESWQRMAKRQGDLFLNIELAVDNYRLNRTLENADKCLEVIYGQTMKKGGD